MLKDFVVPGSTSGTIVFIHGNSSSSKIFNAIMNSDEIVQTKITFDLPGHGEAFLSEECFSIDSYKKILISYIESIHDDILLVGNSLGGHLAIEISKSISRLKGLVIFGTPPLKKPINFEEVFIPNEALNTFLTENPIKDKIEEVIKYAVYNKESQVTITEDFIKANPKVRSSLMQDLQDGSWSNQYQIFTELKIPKFIIKGKQDPSVNHEYLETVCKESIDCTIIEYDECGHYPSLEKPLEFISTMKTISKEVFT